MNLSIIIINYKSVKLVLDCIKSIYEQTLDTTFEIILVDNDSQDDCEAILSEKYPAVIFKQMGYNSGFGRANNAGFSIAKGDYILLLNADTIILDRAIDKCLSLFKAKTNISACGVQLLNPDGSNQISGAINVKGGLNSLLPLPYTGDLVRYLGYKLKRTPPSIKEFKNEEQIDWIVGAFIMVKKENLIQAGYFDEDFFMYYEEIEWCFRLQKTAPLILFTLPKVIHILGGTSNDYYETTENENGKNVWNKKGRQVIVSNMVRIRKQFGVFWFLVNVTIYTANIFVFGVGLCIQKLLTPKACGFTWQNFWGYAYNVWTILKLSGKIILNKPHFYKVA
jgi:GT2 family glycosyltransferase